MFLLVTSLLIFGKFFRQLLHIIYYWTIGLEQLVAILGQIIKNQWLVHINTWVFKQKKKIEGLFDLLMFEWLPLQDRNLNQLASSESSSSGTRNYVPGSSDPHSCGLRQHYPVERKWALGLQVLHTVHFTLLCMT